MKTFRRLAVDVLIFVSIIGTIFYIYQTFGSQVVVYLFGEPTNTIYVDELAIGVTIADEPDERRQGLSGLKSLPELEGKLFVFEETGNYGIWMKDMFFPIDVIWIDENLRIVHIEENVLPNSYPATYNSPVPARFVLETNAFFVDTFQITKGARVTIPARNLPADLQPNLQ